MTTTDPRRIEEACHNSWPALAEVLLGGWLVRFADGVTRRSNSANPIEPARPLRDAIEGCAALYRAKGQRPIFRIPTWLDPAVDRRLDELGYMAEGATIVLARGLGDIAQATPPHPDPPPQGGRGFSAMPADSPPPLRGRVRVGGAAASISVDESPSPAFLDALAPTGATTQDKAEMYRRLILRIAVPARFAVRHDAGAVAALGYASLTDGIACLNAIATAPSARRAGHGEAVVGALLAAAHAAGAHTACLQVVADNAPAIALYRKLGFEGPLFGYHYRVAPQ